MANRVFSAALLAGLAGLATWMGAGDAKAEGDRDRLDPRGLQNAALFFEDTSVPGPSLQAIPALAAFAVPEVAEVSDDVPGEIVVDVRDDVAATDIAALAARFGLELTPASSWGESNDKLELAHVDGDPSREKALLDALAADPRVEGAEPLTVLHASFVPNDPLYASKQWHLHRVGAESAWEYGCGEGVTVAVVDTGVACFDRGPFAKGSDLAGTRCEPGYNFVADTEDAADDQGHGTHVAGTVAQTTNNGRGVAGLAYCARLMPVKVLNRQGWGTVAQVAQGIRFAAQHGAQVINLSLGGSGPSPVVKRAVQYALDRGVVVVAAAGNSGRGVGWPAAYPGVLAVSASDASDRIAWFSSRGPEIALAAPGVAVTQQTVCNGGRDRCELFGTLNGTSMASPHVAGAAALLVGLGVSEPGAVRHVLERSARARDEGHDAQLYGAGILDAGAAAVRAYYGHVLLRGALSVALALFLGRYLRRRRGHLTTAPSFKVGALLGSVGLVPVAPLLHLRTLAGPFRGVVDLLARPLGEWDLVLPVAGAGLHRFLPLANAGPALVAAVLLFGVPRLRPFVGGLALGSAALLAQLALQADVTTVGGPLLLRLWALGNALLCLWIARLAADGRPT